MPGEHHSQGAYWRPGLMLKILAPLIVMAALLALYAYYRWVPQYLGRERAEHLAQYTMEVDLLAKGLSPELRGGDLKEVSGVLDQVRAAYPSFVAITFRGSDGEILYGYHNTALPPDADLEPIRRRVRLAAGEGQLDFLVDMKPLMAAERRRIRQPLQALALVLMAMVAVVALILDRWLRAPLSRLVSAGAVLAAGDYHAALARAGGDEIGVLVGQFDAMRELIAQGNERLRREIEERRLAEARLARDVDLHKILGEVLRLSLEPISLDEMLERILDLMLGLHWLAIESKGAVFLRDNDGEALVMKAHRNMPGTLLARCRSISLGHCLCGQAAQRREVVFSAHVDHRHSIQYGGMPPHGHIIIPILAGGRLLGVINFYVADGAAEERAEIETFKVLADALAIAIEQKRSEILLRKRAQIMAEIRDAVIGVDPQWYITVWNKGAERLLGYADEQIVGRGIGLLFSGADAARRDELFCKTLADGQAEGEMEMVRRDGTTFIAHLSLSLFRDAGAVPDGILAYVLDISETKRMQQALRELNETLEQQVRERTREVLNQKFALDQHSIVGITDKTGCIIYANDKFCEISGYARAELLGRDHRLLNSAFHPRSFFKAMWRTIGRGEVWRGEIRNRRKDGSHYWVETTIVPFMNEEGKPYQYVSIRTDITERKQVYEEQRLRTERLHCQQAAMLSLTHGGIFAGRDPASLLCEIAEIACRGMGAEGVGIWFFEESGARLRCENRFIAAEARCEGGETLERSTHPAYFRTLDNAEVVAAAELQADDRTRELADTVLGRWAVRSILSVPFRIAGKVHGAIVFERGGGPRRWHSDEQHFGTEAANIVALTLEQAARRAAEQRLQEVAQQLMKTNQELDQALIDARVATRVKAEFLSIMSHEVRTPMNGIMGMLELLKDSGLGESDRHYVEIAYKSSRMLLDMLNGVLDYTRIEAGRLQLEAVDFSPRRVVEEVASLMNSLAIAKHLRMEVEAAGDLPERVCADPFRFRQVLVNLINNAVKFTAEGGVTVRVEPDGDGLGDILRIAVRDTGVGIAPEDHARVFEAFAQADSSITRGHGGSGLGLTIAKQLVELMGGEIGVQSVPGKGSVFWFTFRYRRTQAPSLPAEGSVDTTATPSPHASPN